MQQQLPAFRYHPDPLDTGSIVPSDATCRSCGQPRGYVYAPPPSAEEDLESALCPWCIADGSAARQFDAEFTDAASIGGYGQWDEQVSDEIVEEVSRRTPGFSGWQEEKWWTHCGDFAASTAAGSARTATFTEADESRAPLPSRRSKRAFQVRSNERAQPWAE